MKRVIGYFFLLFLSLSSLEAAYTLRGGRLVHQSEVPWMSAQEHYASAIKAYEEKKWEELVRHAQVLSKAFPNSPFAEEALFYLGAGNFELGDLEYANKHLSLYLKKQTASKHFEEAIRYKYEIAERFEYGAKKHLMGWKSLPQWSNAKEEALAIYEEVISALPNHELAAKALFGKARLLLVQKEYQTSIEAFQDLIRRFPKNDLAPKSYLLIAKSYLQQIQKEFPDIDVLDLAEINLKKFKEDFPSDENVKEAQNYLKQMQDVFAQQLYEIGKFYQKTQKPKAAFLYYSKVERRFPYSKYAELSKKTKETLPKEVVMEFNEVKKGDAAIDVPLENLSHSAP